VHVVKNTIPTECNSKTFNTAHH